MITLSIILWYLTILIFSTLLIVSAFFFPFTIVLTMITVIIKLVSTIKNNCNKNRNNERI